MLQALATLLFAAVALFGLGMIAFLLRADWDAFTAALGLQRRAATPAPLPPHYHVRDGRRAVMIRIEPASPRRRAAA